MKLTKRDTTLLIILAILLIGVVYYMSFYTPMKNDLADINRQIEDADMQIQVAMGKVTKMSEMQQELEEILSQSPDKITEIAPYDNAKVVMSQLNGILSVTQNYNLNFQTPKINEDGTVRREVTMKFECPSFSDAKGIIRQLSASHWRCLINAVTVSALDKDYGVNPEETEETTGETTGETTQETQPTTPASTDAILGPVSVTAAITFFENTNIT